MSQMVLNCLQRCGNSPQPCPVQGPAEAHQHGKEMISAALGYPHSMQGRLPLPVVGRHAVATARQRLTLALPTRRSATNCRPALQQRRAAMCAARPSLMLQQPDACAPLGPWPPLPLLSYLPMLTAERVRGMTRLPRPTQLLCWLAVQRWQPRAQAAAPERAPAMLTTLQCTAAPYSLVDGLSGGLDNKLLAWRTECSHPCHRRGTVQGVRSAMAAHYQGARHLEGRRAVRCASATTVSTAGAVGTVHPGQQRGRRCLGAEWCWTPFGSGRQSPHLPWDATHDVYTSDMLQVSLLQGLQMSHSRLTISLPDTRAKAKQ
jgi:hypothetical protein